MKQWVSEIISMFSDLRVAVSMRLSEVTASREVTVAFSTRLAIGVFSSLLLQFTNQF
jgi:hypothetical protein